MRIAINGFGRIGRQLLQAGLQEKEIEFVAINDITDTKTLAYLLKYDSVHGKSQFHIEAKEHALIINGKEIKVFCEKDPSKLPWKQMKIDVVAECSGLFTAREDASRHLQAGAKKILISAPAKNPDATILLGVNEKIYDSKKHNIISTASCTTNCIAPIIKVLNDAFGIEKGFMITTHAYTADQRLVDAPHKDLRRGRSAAINIVPTTTGAAKIIGEIIPELKGKLDGYALRVPVANVSLATLVATLKKETTKEQVNAIFKEASKKMPKIVEYSEEPLVSSDIIHNPASCVFDSSFTYCIGDLVNVNGWYDNEWGYSCRMIDMLKIIAKSL